MRKPLPLHPFLFALFPVLALYAHNRIYVGPVHLIWPVVATLALAAAAVGLARVCVRSGGKAGLVATAFLVFFYTYGHVAAVAFGRRAEATWLDLLLALAWMGLFVLVALILADLGGELRGVTNALNLLTGLLLVATLAQIVPYELHRPHAPRLEVPPPARVTMPAHPPDIYYLILDRYGRADMLSLSLGFDSTPFVEALRRRGFYVAARSNTNYAHTIDSLVSSLNMSYLDPLIQAVGRDNSDQTPLTEAVRDHGVQRFLKAHGYRYVQCGGWWEPTRVNPQADRVLARPGPQATEFSVVLYQTTVARVLPDPFGIGRGPERQRRNLRFQFAALAALPKEPGPKFVFAHILSPHPPWVFGPGGRELPPSQQQSGAFSYRLQLEYTNEQVVRLVDTLVQDSDQPPVIIIQADEGADVPTGGGRLGPSGRPRNAEQAVPASAGHAAILNAYYLPGVKHTGLYPTITPVNSFRLVFNDYFGTDYPLLPDRTWLADDSYHPFHLTEVTGKVR